MSASGSAHPPTARRDRGNRLKKACRRGRMARPARMDIPPQIVQREVVLRRQPRAHRRDCVEARQRQQGHEKVAQDDPTQDECLRGQDLGPARRSQGRVGCEQVLQKGRPGSEVAEDEHRRLVPLDPGRSQPQPCSKDQALRQGGDRVDPGKQEQEQQARPVSGRDLPFCAP